LFPKASADGNAAALDKALEALQAFLEKASDAAASRIAGTVSSNIVAKSLGARPSTVAKGNDCLAAFVEAEQAEKVTVRLLHVDRMRTVVHNCSNISSRCSSKLIEPRSFAAQPLICHRGVCTGACKHIIRAPR
jgi:hypothetical protein